MTIAIFLFLLIGSLATSFHLAWQLYSERTEVVRLRAENDRLLARIGYEYHLSMGTPPPSPGDLPIPVDIPILPTLFRMKPPRSER